MRIWASHDVRAAAAIERVDRQRLATEGGSWGTIYYSQLPTPNSFQNSTWIYAADY
jgi:hypothetical protein